MPQSGKVTDIHISVETCVTTLAKFNVLVAVAETCHVACYNQDSAQLLVCMQWQPDVTQTCIFFCRMQGISGNGNLKMMQTCLQNQR